MNSVMVLEKKSINKQYINNKYELILQISFTLNAQIYKALDIEENKYVAIKMIKLENESLEYKNEIKMLSTMNSKYIPKYIDHFKYGKKCICIVMEFFDSITLKEKLKTKALWSLSEQVLIFKNILTAVRDIHNKNIIHNDLKPENIIYLRSSDIKIIDFGISTFVNDLSKLSKIKGTPKYIAPEILNRKTYDFRSDIYSLGVILYELLTGVSPFENYDKKEIIKEQARNNYMPPNLLRPNINKKMSNIILKALETCPSKRFQTIEEFLDAFCESGELY